VVFVDTHYQFGNMSMIKRHKYYNDKKAMIVSSRNLSCAWRYLNLKSSMSSPALHQSPLRCPCCWINREFEMDNGSWSSC